ncbi:breast cancer metastasis-suppressor 1-like protein [Babylonia areolata]|uniref:breast cancer metastasis-suppressor 1-like protein n=1 Tax=Babylonia areolata TaxID=304850 RepID=UPI003FCF1B85
MMPTLRESSVGACDPEEEDDRYEHDEDDDLGSGSGDDQMDCDDEGCSSDMDSEECDRRKTECMDDMTELSEQFCKIKDQFFSERESMIDQKLKDIEDGKEPEYLSRVNCLEENRKQRIHVAEVLLQMKREAIQERFLSEELAMVQNVQNDKEVLFDQLTHELEEKIKRLEEDRHSIDFTPDFFDCPNDRVKNRFNPFNSERRKKAAQVTGPYIVYNLKDDDIISDWTRIKRASKQQVQRRKVEL